MEINPFCRRVLAKYWPAVRRYEDVRTVGPELEPVDCLVGGFPCQPVSQAGEQRAQADERWLWPEFARIIRVLRPRYVVVENVSNLLAVNGGSAFGEVVGELADCGYDAEWDCLPAAAFGAPHIRNRVWILAYPRRELRSIRDDWRDGRDFLFPTGTRRDAAKWGEDRQLIALVPGVDPRKPADWWRAQSRVDRSVNGLPDRMDRVAGCGNAIVPQIAEWIARRIIEAEGVTA